MTSQSIERPVLELPELRPPPAYAAVCPFIYRSGDPSSDPKSFDFLNTLHIKTMVLLSIEAPSKQLASYCSRSRVQMHHFGIERRWPSASKVCGGGGLSHNLFLSPHEINSFSVLESIVKDSLEILLDTRSYPALVLDTTGIFETGTLIGCLRKMQGWNFASILVEYRSFAGARARSANERFIEVRFY